MKQMNLITMTLTMVLSVFLFTSTAVAGQKLATAKGSNTLKVADSVKQKAVSANCKEAPIAQVVNNTGEGIYQVKLESVVFQENLSHCGTGCSTGFNPVKSGKLKVSVKVNRLARWEVIGSVGPFGTCKKYAVNIKKSGRKICAELFERFQTDTTFNSDTTKKKKGRTCRTYSEKTGRKTLASAGIKKGVQKPAAGPMRAQSPNVTSMSDPGRVQYAPNKPVIENVVFKKASNTSNTLLMSAAASAMGGSGSASSDTVPLIRTEYGTSLTFNVRFTTDNTQTLRVRMLYEGGSHSNLSPGTPRILPDGKKSYSFQTRHIADASERLTLEVKGINPGVGGITTVTKQVELETKSPQFQVRRPSVNDDTRQVTFRVKNTGNMNFPAGPVTVRYTVKGMPGNVTIESGTHRASDISINRNHTVPVFTLTLPESAVQYNRIQMEATITGTCNSADLPSASDSYSYTWETHTFTINDTLVDIFSALFSGNVQINTFEHGHGNRSSSQPYVNDSRIDLTIAGMSGGSSVISQAINIPSFKFGSTPFELLVLVDSLNAPITGRDLFFVRDGKLGLRISFDCSASRELEVWARDAIAHEWVDNWWGDIDLRGFTIELMLTPTLVGQTLSYSDMTMNADVNLEIPGHRIERWLEREAAAQIESSFAPVFDNATVRSTIENAFQELLTSPLLNVRHLISVRGAGSSIEITYR